MGINAAHRQVFSVQTEHNFAAVKDFFILEKHIKMNHGRKHGIKLKCKLMATLKEEA